MRQLLLCGLVLALAACGPSPSSAPATPAPAAAPAAPALDPAEMQARVAALPAPYNEASFEAGMREFATCRTCHTLAAGGANRVGPNLHGVFSREIGALEGFSYSPAVQAADFAWTPEQLDHWLENPRTFLPGNRMAFAGVRDATKRRDLIAYLLVTTAED